MTAAAVLVNDVLNPAVGVGSRVKKASRQTSRDFITACVTSEKRELSHCQVQTVTVSHQHNPAHQYSWCSAAQCPGQRSPAASMLCCRLLQMPSQLQPPGCQASAPLASAHSLSPLAEETLGRSSLWQRWLPTPPTCIRRAGPQPCSKGAGRCWFLWI